MTLLRTVVEEISTYLVDQEPEFEFEHWTEAELVTYARDAARILALNFKSDYVARKVVTLQPGGKQTLPPGCDKFVSLDGMVGKDGAVIGAARRTSTGSIGTLRVPACAPTKGAKYQLTSWQFDLSDQRSFFVDPPVPPREQVRVAIRCFGPPAIEGLDVELPIPDYQIPILKELMLYYAYGVDTESVPARQYMDTHWRNAAALIAAERGIPVADARDTIPVT